MKVIRYAANTVVLAGVALLASCGGGGDDEAGAAEPFAISPTEKTVTWTAGTACGEYKDVAKIFVYGGAAPYQINVTDPDLVTVDQSSVQKNGSFMVSYLGGTCFDPSSIVVVDSLGRRATLTLKSTNK